MKRMLSLALWITLGGHAVAQLREIPLPFADTTCFRVQFVDEDHGWVAGLAGTIFHTTDGGLTWNTYASPYPTGAITEIRFSTKDYGILWANPDPNAYSGRLYQTFNAAGTGNACRCPMIHYSFLTSPPSRALIPDSV